MKILNSPKKLTTRSRAGCYLLLLAGLLAIVMPLHADNPPTYLFQIDSSAVPGGFQPWDVALDTSNNLYVTDYNNSKVEKFDRSGNYLTQWIIYGTPSGVTADSSNNIYVSFVSPGRVWKSDSNGNYLREWDGYATSSFDYPTGIAANSSNDVYVADTYNQKIWKFDSNGNFLTSWGSLGSGNGQFTLPVGVAVDTSNNVYVKDYNNNRVEKFDSNGNYLIQWGSLGFGNGQFAFNATPGLAVDSGNHVYVIDDLNNRIEKFDNNGNYLTQWGSQGSVNGQFGSPSGVVVGSSGNLIYVADGGNRIQVFVNNANIVPPIFSSQVASQIVPQGTTVTFGVSVVGTAPFAYQWMSNNVALPNATNSTFILANVTPTDSANYTVAVTNNFGSALSRNAVLTVLPVAIAITQPASSVSSTGAVLNASVTIGPNETVVWFDWGTDTNYGNIVGTTVVSGNNGTNSVSAALTGLPGNFYHYRIVATNDFGIVYGNDQLFTVGFAPAATTLAAVTSTNGATLNATVNPNGWDTTVYFVWGTYGYALTNTTSWIDIGAGAGALNASNSITGLAQGTRYDYQVVASNYLGTTTGFLSVFVPALAPPFSSAPPSQWQSVATSADGTKLIAAGQLYLSTNAGATWFHPTTPFSGAEGVASSVDGTKLFAVVTGGSIYVSTNSGATWTNAPTVPSYTWNAIASSADGRKLAAVAENLSAVYTSTNSGVNWTFRPIGLPVAGIDFIASSADGSKLVACAGGIVNGPILTSTNSGVNWTKATNAPLARWYSVASSADGKKLAACAYFLGNVYLSTDAGVTWIKTSLPTNNWNSVAESADGTKMVALANGNSAVFGTRNGGIFTSTDSGATWVSNNVPSWAWTCAAMSADGNEFIATIGYPSTAGGIYVSQTTPAPVLNLSASANDTMISWIIPSLDFTLQQSPDLSNWTAVTNLPVLNLTNLQNQVTLPPPDGNSFFRLTH